MMDRGKRYTRELQIEAPLHLEGSGRSLNELLPRTCSAWNEESQEDTSACL